MQLLDPQTGLVVWDQSWGTPMPQGGRYIEFDGPTQDMRQPAPRVNALGQIFNGTGIVPRVNALHSLFNPVVGLQEAGQHSVNMLAPGRAPTERISDLGKMLTGMAGTVAPMVAASRGAMPAADAVVDAMTGFSAMPKARAGEFMADEFGGALAPALGDPVAARGAQILDLLRSGKARKVTDEMLDLGDPTLNARLSEYLYQNYDLPMDEASRMARAGEKGFANTPTYHATSADITDVNLSAADQFAVSQGERAFFTTTQPKTADTYLPGAFVTDRFEGAPLGDGVVRHYSEGANVIPTLNKTDNAEIWDMGGGSYRGISSEIAEARRAKADAVIFQRMKDQGIMGLGSGSRDNVTVAALKPNAVRSRFARFDPRLAHLRNLLAGSAGLGFYLNGEEQP